MFENNYTILELEAMPPMMRMFREALYEAKEITKRKKASHPGVIVHPDIVPYLERFGHTIERSSIGAHIQIAQVRSLVDHISYGNIHLDSTPSRSLVDPLMARPEIMILDDLEAKEDETPDQGYLDAFRYSQYKHIEDQANEDNRSYKGEIDGLDN